MGVLGDTLDEFKQAKTPEKMFIVGGVLAVIGVAWYIHSHATGSAPSRGVTGASLSGGGGGGIQTVPTANGGSVPILPGGLNPIFDSQGNLLGYQPSPTPSPTPSPSPSTPSPYTPLLSSLPSGFKQAFGQTISVNGVTYTVGPGSNNKLWGVPGKGMSLQQFNNVPIATGQKQLLYVSPPKQGGGPYGTRVLGHRSTRIAPSAITHRQSSVATRVYAMRNR